MYFESKETEFASKAEQWNRIAAEVELIVDKLGKRIDEGIKETVVALRASGLGTDGSCEGHLSTGKKVKGPWVDIGQTAQEILDRFKRKTGGKPPDLNDPEFRRVQKELDDILLHERAHLLALLDEFYSHRNVPVEERLIVNFHSVSSRIISQGVALQDMYPPEVQAKRLESFRREMDAFTAFLRKKYFQHPE